MPLLRRGAARLRKDRGRDIVVRGAVTGPFSLASALAGSEGLLVATVEDPAFVRELVAWAARTAVDLGRAYLERGVEPVLFDSKASPAAGLAPRLPRVRPSGLPGRRHAALRRAGARGTPLIIGGDTTAILEDIVRTGAPQLLCDAGADLMRFLGTCRAERRALRASVDARSSTAARPRPSGPRPGASSRRPKDSRGSCSGAASWPTTASRGTSSPCGMPATSSAALSLDDRRMIRARRPFRR